jgi:hypothetical protein
VERATRYADRAKFYRKWLILCNRGLRISFPQVKSVRMTADRACKNVRFERSGRKLERASTRPDVKSDWTRDARLFPPPRFPEWRDRALAVRGRASLSSRGNARACWAMRCAFAHGDEGAEQVNSLNSLMPA